MQQHRAYVSKYDGMFGCSVIAKRREDGLDYLFAQQYEASKLETNMRIQLPWAFKIVFRNGTYVFHMNEPPLCTYTKLSDSVSIVNTLLQCQRQHRT